MVSVGSGRSVAVVRAGREILVVGVAENSVTPIRSYSEAEAIALGIEVPSEESRNAEPVFENGALLATYVGAMVKWGA